MFPTHSTWILYSLPICWKDITFMKPPRCLSEGLSLHGLFGGWTTFILLIIRISPPGNGAAVRSAPNYVVQSFVRFCFLFAFMQHETLWTPTELFKPWPCWPPKYERPQLRHLNTDVVVQRSDGGNKARFYCILKDRWKISRDRFYLTTPQKTAHRFPSVKRKNFRVHFSDFLMRG